MAASQQQQQRQQMPLPSISTLKRGNAFDFPSTASPHYPTPPYSSPASDVNSEHGGGGGPLLRRSPRRHHRADHHGMMTPVVPHEELASMLDNYLDEGGGGNGGGDDNYQNNGQGGNYYSDSAYSRYPVSSNQQSFNYGYAQQQQQHQQATSFQQQQQQHYPNYHYGQHQPHSSPEEPDHHSSTSFPSPPSSSCSPPTTDEAAFHHPYEQYHNSGNHDAHVSSSSCDAASPLSQSPNTNSARRRRRQLHSDTGSANADESSSSSSDHDLSAIVNQVLDSMDNSGRVTSSLTGGAPGGSNASSSARAASRVNEGVSTTDGSAKGSSDNQNNSSSSSPFKEQLPLNKTRAVAVARPMQRTVGVVEPRVVVKIPWSKVQSQQQDSSSNPSSYCVTSPALSITSPSKVTLNCGGGVGIEKGEERVLLEHPLLHPSTQSPTPSSDVAASSPSSSLPSPKRCRHSRRGRGRRHHRCKKHKHTGEDEGEEEEEEVEKRRKDGEENEKREEVGISFHRDKKRRKKQLEKKKEKKKKLLEEEVEEQDEEEGGGDHVAPLGSSEKASSEKLRLPHPHHPHHSNSDQIQHFHITETLPEHFKRVLRSSQYGSSLLGDVYLEGHQRERERDVATGISELKEVQSKQKVRVGRDEDGSRDSQRQEEGGELSQSVDETIKYQPKRRGRKRKQTSQVDVEEEADSQMKGNGKSKRGRRGRKASEVEEGASSNRMNSLKLIIRTNQRGCVSVQEEGRSATCATDRGETRIEEDEEDVVEIVPSFKENDGDEKVLVDLAAEEDEEDQSRNPYPIKGAISGKEMEEYLRKRMPLLHVSIVKTDEEKEKDDENKKGELPVVRLKRLSPEQIESMAQGTAKEEDSRRGGEGEQLRSLQPLPDAVAAAEGLSERGGNGNNNMASNLNNRRREGEDIYQTLECGRSLEGEDMTMQQSKGKTGEESPSYRHSNKGGEKGGERVICADEREKEKERGNECGGSQHYKRSISNNKDDVAAAREEKVPLSHSMAEWKLDEKSDKEKENEEGAIGKANKERICVEEEVGKCSNDASFEGVRDNGLDLQALAGNHDDCERNGEGNNDLVEHEEDSRSPAYALVTPDNGLTDEDQDGAASNEDVVTGNDPMINSVVVAEGNNRVSNLVDDDFLDIDSAFESLIGSSETGPNTLVSTHADNSNGSNNGHHGHGSMSMPILFSDDGNVQDFSTILNFQNFEMQAFDTSRQPNNKEQQGNNSSNSNNNPFLHNEANPSLSSSGQSGDRLNENPSEKGKEEEWKEKEEASADNGGGKEEKKGNNKEIEDDDDDNEVLCLTPPSPAKKRGRPRKYPPRSDLSRLREEAVDDDLVMLDSPPPSVSPSRIKRTTSIVSEDDDPADSIWMHCGRKDCEFYTRKPHKMDRHMLCHTSDTRLRCPDCGDVFNSLARLLKHDRREHGRDAHYECKICEAEVTDINVHMKVHRKEKEYKCDVCHREFRHKNSLVRHMVQHAGERPFHCQFCNYTFATLAKQKDHMRKKHEMLMKRQQLAQQLRIKARVAANAQLPAAMRHYQPIAPAPAKPLGAGSTLAPPPPIAPKPSANGGGFPSIYQQRQHQMHQLQQQLMHQQPSLPILAQGPNGSMLLITNPNPIQPQVNNQQQSLVMGPNGMPILLNHSANQPLIQQQQQQPFVLNSSGTLTTLGPATNPTQPLFVQPPPPTQTILASHDTASSSTPASSVMSSVLSPRDAAMLTAPTPEAPTPEPSKEPLLDIPKQAEKIDENAQFELTNEDGSVTLASPDKIVFELSDNDSSKSHMTMTTDNGLTVKLDILERAMLEIPDLEPNENSGSVVAPKKEQKREKEEEKEAPNEPSRAQSGRENDKIEEEEVNEISDDDSPATATDEKEEEEGDTDSIEASPKGGMETEEESGSWSEDDTEEEEEEEKGGALLGGGESQQTNLVCNKTDEKKDSVAKKTMEPIKHKKEIEKEPEETMFSCEKCGKKYKFMNFLKVHQRRPCT